MQVALLSAVVAIASASSTTATFSWKKPHYGAIGAPWEHGCFPSWCVGHEPWGGWHGHKPPPVWDGGDHNVCHFPFAKWWKVCQGGGGHHHPCHGHNGHGGHGGHGGHPSFTLPTFTHPTFTHPTFTHPTKSTKPIPTKSTKPIPTKSTKPIPTKSTKPIPTKSTKPVPTTTKPVPTTTKPVPSTSTKPKPSTSTKPPKPSTSTKPKPSTSTKSTTTAKPPTPTGKCGSSVKGYPCSDEFKVVFTNYTTVAKTGVYKGQVVGAATIDIPNYLTYGLVDTIGECFDKCSDIEKCAFVNTYREYNSTIKDNYGKGKLTCAIFSKCSDACSATNYGGQDDPTYVEESNGYCKSADCA